MTTTADSDTNDRNINGHDNRGDGDWFPNARFGLFVHWGIFSAAAREPSWPVTGPSTLFPKSVPVTVDEYYASVDDFQPVPDAPRAWVELAAAAGMTYAVLTTKHHDGYTLFPSEHSAFGTGQTLDGRDLVGEFVAACRDHGLRVGLYFSLPDWHHPDYPAWTDDMRPYTLAGPPLTDPDAWERFRTDQVGQLRHLLSAYGKIDLLWFDGGWERSADTWDSAALETMIRSLQPDIVINDRLPGVTGYSTPEQAVPSSAPADPWETCLTMGESWGPVPDDDQKSPYELLLTLAEVACRGGNLLLNLSPDGAGVVPDWQRQRIEYLGRWMAAHGDAIVGTEAGLEPWQFAGPTTRRGDTVHLICPYRPSDLLLLRGVHGLRLEQVTVQGTGQEVPFHVRTGAVDRLFSEDPTCAVVIDTSQAELDEPLPVLVAEFAPKPIRG